MTIKTLINYDIESDTLHFELIKEHSRFGFVFDNENTSSWFSVFNDLSSNSGDFTQIELLRKELIKFYVEN